MFFFCILEVLNFLTQFLQLGLLLIQFLDITGIEIGVLREPLHVLTDASMFRRDLGGALVSACSLCARVVQLIAQMHDSLQRLFHF